MAVASRASISFTISDMGPIGLTEARAAAAVGAHGALPNAQPPRAPKGHRKRRFQSGQPFGLRAPRATRSIPGAATVSAACCASSAAPRYAWRRSTNRWARLGRHHATVACDINGHIRGTRPRRSRVSTSRRWSRAVGRGLVVRPPKREHQPTVLRQPEEVQLVQRAPWCQQPRRAG